MATAVGDSGCWSPISGVSHPPSLTPLWRCHLPSCWSVWPGAGPFSAAPCRGQVSPPSTWADSMALSTRAAEHSAEMGSWSHYEPHRHEGPNLLKASSPICPGAQNSMKNSGWLGCGIWTDWLQNPCKEDSVPCESGVVGSSTVKGRQYTPQGWLLCSDSNEKSTISSNACTWCSAKSAQRTEAGPGNLREALQAMGGTQCSPHLALKQCQNMSSGTQAPEWQSGHLCSTTPTSSGHSFHHFHWGESSLILTTAPQTFILTDERFQTARTI